MLKCFKVEFYRGIEGLGPFVHVLASYADDAAILAKAQRILSGHRDHVIEHVFTVADPAVLKKLEPMMKVGLPRILDIEAVLQS
jgi:hypothetical protein